jgi:acetyltransferase-like isoleucine patch superfamily enzyme
MIFKIGLFPEVYNAIKNTFVYWRQRKHLKFGKNLRLVNSNFDKKVFIDDNCIVLNTFIDRYSYLGKDCIINNSTIGKFCSISNNVKIGLGTHPSSAYVSSSPYFYVDKKRKKFSFASEDCFDEFKKSVVGNDVWIGVNAVVMDGVQIGNGAVIAACAVVTRDVMPYEIVAGIPAKHLRYRFDNEEINFLEKIKWWEFSEEYLSKNWKSFSNIELLKNLLKSNEQSDKDYFKD